MRLRMSTMRQIFSTCSRRPFIKQVWSEFINFGSEASILLAMALVAILQSTLSKVIGHQFDKFDREPSSFGIRVMMPLPWEMESSFAS